MRDWLADQLVSAVRFRETVEAMYEDGVRTFVEVGPGSVLSALVADCLKDRPHAAIPLDRKGANGLVSLWRALGQLSVLGLSIDFAALWAEYPETEAAKAPPAPAHAVQITGANYDKVYPPEGGSDALPRPNPPKPPEAAPQPAAKPAPPPPGAPQTGGLDAFQNTLLQTHQSFQTAMMESHRAFLDMAERTLARMSGDGAALPPMPAFETPAAPMPAPVPAPVEPAVAEPAPPKPVAATPTQQPSKDIRSLLLDIRRRKNRLPHRHARSGHGIGSRARRRFHQAGRDPVHPRERAPDLPRWSRAT